MKSNFFSSPLILICDKISLDKEIKRSRFSKNIEKLKLDEIYSKKFEKKKIYLINTKHKNSNTYVHNCFKIAFKLIKEGLAHRMINGPINKTKTLNKKYLGITEYVAKNFNQNKFANNKWK